MVRTKSVTIGAALVGVLALFLAAAPVEAQLASPSEDPDVQGAIRLFSAWLDGQVAYRQLPGVVVGVVSDQELVWAQGFGFANVDAKRPMALNTRFRMASHSKLFTATAIMQLREQGRLRLDDPVSEYLPWFRVQSAATGRSADHYRAPAHPQLRPSARGRIALERLGVSHPRGAERAHPEAAGAILTRDPLEVLEPGVHDRRDDRRSGERRDVGAISSKQHLRSARDVGIERGPRRRKLGHGLQPPHAGRVAAGHSLRRCARDGRGNRPHVLGRRHGEVRLGPVPEGAEGWRPDSQHRFSAGDASCADAREHVDPRVRGSGSRSGASGTSCTWGTGAAIRAIRRTP